MEGFKSTKPHFSQGCDRLLAMISEHQKDRPSKKKFSFPTVDENYWKNLRDHQEIPVEQLSVLEDSIISNDHIKRAD
jgi:hypothetical protein